VTNEDLKTHKAEQAQGLRPPPVSRIGLHRNKRSYTNRKAQMKAMYAGRLDELVSYLLERLAMARELQAERDKEQ